MPLIWGNKAVTKHCSMESTIMDLADKDDPYVNNAGKLIEHVGTVENEFELADKRRVLPAIKTMGTVREISIDDLPEPDNQMQAAIAAIVGFRLMGLSLVDIAEVMKVGIDKIQSIVSNPAAQITFEKMYRNIISSNSESIQGRISAHAGSAVDTVVSLMTDAEVRDDVRLKAAQDVLDRSGTNADQFFSEGAQNNQADDELRIVFTDASGEKERVSVEIKKK
jgi:hypothetical protein